MINLVALKGNLTRSSELKYWQNGTAYCDFSIAVNESYKDKQTNEWKSIPSYFDCRMKGKYAEAWSKHLLKGRAVYVQGKLQQQRWEQDGQKFSRVLILVEQLQPEWSNQNKDSQHTDNQQNNYQQSNQNINQQQKAFNAVNESFGPSEPEWVDFEQMPEDIPF